MSQHAPPIPYATPISHSRMRGSHVAGVLAVAIVVGFVTANPFADAVGFPQVQSNSEGGIVFLRLICGAVMAFVAGVVTVFIARGIRALIATLGETRQRPSAAVAITLLAAGTVCVIMALVLPLLLARPVVLSANVNAMAMGVQTPMLTDFLAILTFLLGAIMIAIGIWGGMRHEAGEPRPLAAIASAPSM